MPVEFYYLAMSPPCRGVWMVLEALGVEYTDKFINILNQENKTPEFAKINWRQKIPAIRDGDFVLGESRAIATYLCEEYAARNNKTSIYPNDAKLRARINQMLYVDENWSEQLMSYINIGGVVMRGEKPKTENVDKVKEVLGAVEKVLNERKYIAADQLTIADFFVYVTVGLLQMTEYKEYDAYPKLVAWQKTMSELPYHKKTCEEPLGQLGAFYKSKLQ
uniref:glutathione S-transferase 1-like n=1 Tax=Styela clava TaxID=7725 RepID=UPI001939C5BD|nr:glutathione S-transferase 1-like [Styela clava]